MTRPPKCPACGVRIRDHLGLSGTCRKLQEARAIIADCIRRPMGVIPDSAQEWVSDEDLRAAEERRIKE